MSKPVGKIERAIWMSVTIIVLFGALYGIRRFQQQALIASQRAKIALENERGQRQENHRLAKRLEEVKSGLLRPDELDELKQQGLRQPIGDLIADLRRHPELIPHKGVLGGTMKFYDSDSIYIVSRKWAVAGFDDGHILGKALLEYKVSKGGRISWKVVETDLEG